MLALAARRADIVGINPSLHSGAIDEHAGPTATAEATDSKLAVVRDAAGDRFDASGAPDPGAPGRDNR